MDKYIVYWDIGNGQREKEVEAYNQGEADSIAFDCMIEEAEKYGEWGSERVYDDGD